MGIELYENAEKSNAPTQSKDAAADRRVTLKDIAEKSGFSLRTVKKVMSGKEYVSESVKEKIILTGKQLNYKRNKIASALAKNQELKIAIIYTKMSKYYFPDIRKGFESCAKDYLDYGIEIEFFIDNEAKQDILKAQIRQLQELQNRDDIDGIVIQPYTSKQLAFEIDKLTAAGKPVVAFGSDIINNKRLAVLGRTDTNREEWRCKF